MTTKDVYNTSIFAKAAGAGKFDMLRFFFEYHLDLETDKEKA